MAIGLDLPAGGRGFFHADADQGTSGRRRRRRASGTATERYGHSSISAVALLRRHATRKGDALGAGPSPWLPQVGIALQTRELNDAAVSDDRHHPQPNTIYTGIAARGVTGADRDQDGRSLGAHGQNRMSGNPVPSLIIATVVACQGRRVVEVFDGASR